MAVYIICFHMYSFHENSFIIMMIDLRINSETDIWRLVQILEVAVSIPNMKSQRLQLTGKLKIESHHRKICLKGHRPVTILKVYSTLPVLHSKSDCTII